MKILLPTASVVALLVAAPAFAANAPSTNAPAADAKNSLAATQPPANQAAPAQPTGTTANTARPNGTAATPASQAQNSPDPNFVQQAAHGGRAEVAMGNLAEIRGATSAVREFGR
jgi:putative membrane protein